MFMDEAIRCVAADRSLNAAGNEFIQRQLDRQPSPPGDKIVASLRILTLLNVRADAKGTSRFVFPAEILAPVLEMIGVPSTSAILPGTRTRGWRGYFKGTRDAIKLSLRLLQTGLDYAGLVSQVLFP